MRKPAVALSLCLAASTASAQTSPGLSYGQVPTAGQWNSYFAAKQDLLRYTPLNQAGGTMGGKLQTAPSTANGAGFAILPGVAPTAPVNGDLWMTSLGLFARIGGVTLGPINGTVTGVALAVPSRQSVTGSPVTTAGTLTIADNAQNAATLFAGPATGAAAMPTFRAMAATDLPSSGVTAGSYVLPTLAIDTYGRVTGASQGTLSGDIATAAGSLATTIQPSVVTNAKLANAPAATIKGNASAASAAPSDSALTAYLDAGLSTTQGALAYRGAGAWVALPPGSSGQVLGSGGSNANPAWQNAGGNGTVTQVNTGAGVAGGPITSTGTIAAADNLAQGRLTLTSGVPVMTATATGQGTVYYTPYIGNLVPIWNGSTFVEATFAEYGQALSDTTYSPSAAVANACYDVFSWNSGGTVRATRGPAWSAGATAGSNTARGSGAGSTALNRVSGLLVNANAITNGPAAGYGTYLGTFCTDVGGATVTFNTGTAAVGGGAAFLGLWNNFNRIPVGGIVSDTTNSWTYAATNPAAWRAADNSTGIRLTYVQGLPEDTWGAAYNAVTIPPGSGSSGNAATGVGVDTVTAFTGSPAFYGAGGSLISEMAVAQQRGAIGVHYLSAIEYVSAGTMTGYGTAGGATYVQSGLTWTGRY